MYTQKKARARHKLVIIVIALLLVAQISQAATVVSDNDPSMGRDDKLITVAVSGNPLLVYIVEFIGGSYVDVLYLYPGGVDIHDYELSPRDLERIAEADLIILDGWNHTPANMVVWRSFSGSKVIIDLYRVSIEEGWKPLRVDGVMVIDEFLYDPQAFNISVEAIASYLSMAALSRGNLQASIYFDRSSTMLVDLYSYIVRESRSLVNGSRAVLVSPIMVYPAIAVGLDIDSVIYIGEGYDSSGVDLDRVRSAGCVIGSVYDGPGIYRYLKENGVAAVAVDFSSPIFLPLKIAYEVFYRCRHPSPGVGGQDDSLGGERYSIYLYLILGYSIAVTALMVIRYIGGQFERPRAR